MIDVTKMNGMNITINSDLIETVEDTPDTVITLTTGRKIIVKESRQTIKNLVKSFDKKVILDDISLQIKKGEIVRKVPEAELLDTLREELEHWAK